MLLASYTTIVLDISIVIMALPKIHRTLDFSATTQCRVGRGSGKPYGPVHEAALTGPVVQAIRSVGPFSRCACATTLALRHEKGASR